MPYVKQISTTVDQWMQERNEHFVQDKRSLVQEAAKLLMFCEPRCGNTKQVVGFYCTASAQINFNTKGMDRKATRFLNFP